MSDLRNPPKAAVGDTLHAVVRAGLGAIPVAGNAAVELFNAIVTPPLERRRDEWRKSVGEKLKELEDAGCVRAEDLMHNDAFITTMMQASNAAIRNHQPEKLDALRNAVANAALPHPPEASIQQLFIQFVDGFTVWHLRMLDLMQDARRWFQNNGKSAPQFAISSSFERVLLAAYPELDQHREFYDLIDADLKQRGLSAGSGMHVMMSAEGAYQKHTTTLGDQFLAFISPPKLA